MDPVVSMFLGKIGFLSTVLVYVCMPFVLVLSIFLSIIVTVCCRRRWFHPLARVPGPLGGALSSAWLAREVRDGRLFALGTRLHAHYGPMVRVRPNEVWLVSAEGVRAVYGLRARHFHKSSFYRATALTQPTLHWFPYEPSIPRTRQWRLWTVLTRWMERMVQMAVALWTGDWTQVLRVEAPDSLDLLSEVDVDRYKRQRAMIAPLYRTAHVAKWRPVVRRTVSTFLDKVWSTEAVEEQGHAAGRPPNTRKDSGSATETQRAARTLDLKMWMHMLVVETLGAVVLSWSPGYVRDGTDHHSSAHSYAMWRRKSVLGLYPSVVFAQLVDKSIGRLFLRAWGVTHPAPAGLKPFFVGAQKCIRKRTQNLGSDTAKSQKQDPQKQSQNEQPQREQPHKQDPKQPPKKSKKPPKPKLEDLMDDLVTLHHENPHFTEAYLLKMTMTNFGAGHETMTATLVAFWALVGSNPAVQKTLYEEVIARKADIVHRKPSPDLQEKNNTTADGEEQEVKLNTLSPRQSVKVETPSSKPVEGAPSPSPMSYLQACLLESQRLYPVIGMSLSRVVPESGLFLHDQYLPPGTIVGCNPVAVHRNPAIFGDDADTFRPERWLTDCAKTRRRMERCLLAWGGGNRSCPGRALAEMALTTLLTDLIQAWEVETVSLPTADEVQYYYLGMLTTVNVKVRRRSDGAHDSCT